MTHAINQNRWGEIVLVDYNEGFHKSYFRNISHDCTLAKIFYIYPLRKKKVTYNGMLCFRWPVVGVSSFCLQNGQLTWSLMGILCFLPTFSPPLLSSVSRKRCSSDLCWTKHLFSLCGSSGGVWNKTCECCMCSFFIYKLVLNGTCTGICICGPINAPDDYYIK